MDKATLHILPLTVGELATRCYVLWLEGRDDCLVIDQPTTVVSVPRKATTAGPAAGSALRQSC